jgi:hypothetical protein
MIQGRFVLFPLRRPRQMGVSSLASDGAIFKFRALIDECHC